MRNILYLTFVGKDSLTKKTADAIIPVRGVMFGEKILKEWWHQ
jgi:hypothetical protein